jgi:hypothetical protein
MEQDFLKMINEIFTPMELNFIAENIKNDGEKYIEALFNVTLKTLNFEMDEIDYKESLTRFKTAIKDACK